MNRRSERDVKLVMPEKYRRPDTHERLRAVERMKRDWAAQKGALATVRRFNAANGKAWFWPKIAAALVSKHHWLAIVRDSCDMVTAPFDRDLELGVADLTECGQFPFRAAVFLAAGSRPKPRRALLSARRIGASSLPTRARPARRETSRATKQPKSWLTTHHSRH